jgi:hypothetical protein
MESHLGIYFRKSAKQRYNEYARGSTKLGALVSKSRTEVRTNVWVCGIEAVEAECQEPFQQSGRKRRYWCGGQGEECAWDRKGKAWVNVLRKGCFADKWWAFPINTVMNGKPKDNPQGRFEELMEDIVAFMDADVEADGNEQDIIFACQKGANRQVAAEGGVGWWWWVGGGGGGWWVGGGWWGWWGWWGMRWRGWCVRWWWWWWWWWGVGGV